MKFYDRIKEPENLQRIEKLSSEYAQMTVITGRRRIGKTTLIKRSLQTIPLVYFFVSKKSEALHCQELTEIVETQLGVRLGRFTSMAKLFEALMFFSKSMNFSLVFDEFQNYVYINPSLFSDFQNIWDTNKDDSKINLVFCGSIFSTMSKIFDNTHEPLYGRATNRLKIRPFTIVTLKEILNDYNPSYTPDDLLSFYILTGGVAKYVEQLVQNSAFTKDSIFNYALSVGSYFLNEGKNLMIDEFGKDYGNYFSVLSAIADGNTTRSQINNYVQFESGGFLDRLENNYDLIRKMRPLGSDINSRNVKYYISDNFLTFWFRYVYRYRSAVEIDNLDFILQKLNNDYPVFSGTMLEKYFRQKYLETGNFNEVSNFWNRDGLDEIDLLAVNDIEKQLVVAEVKRNPQRANIQKLQEKTLSLSQKLRKMKMEFLILGLEDM